MTWHLEETAAAQYVRRGLDATSVASVESHLSTCDRCRARVGAEIDDRLLGSMWDGITAELDRPEAGVFERVLRRLGCSDLTSRIVTATTRARWSFLLAVALSLVLAQRAAQSADEQYFGIYLIVAPLGPLLATAGSFGRWTDPVYALVTTTPTSSLRILLIRIVASVVPALGLTALAVPFALDRGWLAVSWLLPSLALASCALALSARFAIERAAIGLGLVWLSLPLLLRVPLRRLLELFGPSTQLVSGLLQLVAAVVLVTRPDTFDPMEG